MIVDASWLLPDPREVRASPETAALIQSMATANSADVAPQCALDRAVQLGAVKVVGHAGGADAGHHRVQTRPSEANALTAKSAFTKVSVDLDNLGPTKLPDERLSRTRDVNPTAR
jgi:hypothetical protein